MIAYPFQIKSPLALPNKAAAILWRLYVTTKYSLDETLTHLQWLKQDNNTDDDDPEQESVENNMIILLNVLNEKDANGLYLGQAFIYWCWPRPRPLLETFIWGNWQIIWSWK